MRTTTLLLLLALGLTGCGRDATSPSNALVTIDEAESLVLSSSIAVVGSKALAQLARLPQSLALTSAQQAAIKALTDAFALVTKADQDALAALKKQIRDASVAGTPKEQIQALLDQARVISDRLAAAEARLRDDILALLTAEQRAWLEANQPTPCTLAEGQQSRIGALLAAYEQANRSDLDAINAALAQAKTAQKNGATREQISAILNPVKAAMERVRAAGEALQKAIQGVLTPEQLASHCIVALMPLGK